MDAWRLASIMNSIIGNRQGGQVYRRTSSSGDSTAASPADQNGVSTKQKTGAADGSVRNNNTREGEEKEASTTDLLHFPEWPKPGVTKDEFNRARERHDVFNILGMLPVMVFTVLDFSPSIFWEPPGPWLRPGPYFWYLWWSTAFFTVADSIWLYRVPHCVRTPSTILEHHAVMLLYISAPLPMFQFSVFMGPLMSVEINSFFSFCRRVAWKRDYLRTGNFFHILFLTSWIFTRCLIYPALMLVFVRYGLTILGYPLVVHVLTWCGWLEDMRRPLPDILPLVEHLPFLYFPVHVYFVVMNFKWTNDLFTPIVRKWYGKARGWLGLGAKGHE